MASLSDVILELEQQPQNGTFETMSTNDVPYSFTLFSSLPPELQLLVWEHALSQCFYPNYSRVARYISNGRPARYFWTTSKVKIVWLVTYTRLQDRWMPLMLTCKMSNAAARNEKLYPDGWF